MSGSIGEEAAVELLKQGVWDFVLKDRLARPGACDPSAVWREVAEQAARRESRGTDEAGRGWRLRNTLEGIMVADARASDHFGETAHSRRSRGHAPEQILGRGRERASAVDGQDCGFLRQDVGVGWLNTATGMGRSGIAARTVAATRAWFNIAAVRSSTSTVTHYVGRADRHQRTQGGTGAHRAHGAARSVDGSAQPDAAGRPDAAGHRSCAAIEPAGGPAVRGP